MSSTQCALHVATNTPHGPQNNLSGQHKSSVKFTKASVTERNHYNLNNVPTHKSRQDKQCTIKNTSHRTNYLNSSHTAFAREFYRAKNTISLQKLDRY